MRGAQLWSKWVWFAGAALLLSCASDGDESGTGGAGGSGAAGGASSCAEDCSAIQTDPCEQASCNGATGLCEVSAIQEGAACDDGLFCTLNETCESGQCTGGLPNTCGMDSQCAMVSCDEASQTCTAGSMQPDGTPCAAADLCIINDSCMAGQCVGDMRECFFAPNIPLCHVGECNPADGECIAVPDADDTPCDDPNDICTDNKTCIAGMCQGGGPKDCSGVEDGCNSSMCDTTQGCLPVPLAQGTACPEGTDTCNDGFCDNAGTCIANPVNEGAMCADGLTCTNGSTCQSGECTGGFPPNFQLFLYEDFNDNAAGWTLGNEWEIGPAKLSMGATWGLEDPDVDATPNHGNGVAGIIIGGHAAVAMHAMVYLESPAFDTSGPGSVYFEYQRWLNTTLGTHVYDTVEVWDGSNWQIVWDTTDITNFFASSWTKVSHDVTQYKNAQMRVRYGFEVFAQQIPVIASWNVDDVLVSNQPCL